MSRRTSDLQLERYLAEALSPGDTAALEATLRESAEDQAALAALRAETAALFVTHPPAAFAHRVGPKKKPWQWLGGLVAAAAAFSLAWFVVIKPPDDDLRTKGAHAWGVTVARQGQVQPASASKPLHAGDVLSFEVTTPSAAFAAVLSHAPDGFAVYAPLEHVPAGVTVLGQAASLDGLVGAEVLYLLISPHEFDVGQVRQALEADASLTHFNDVVVERRAFTKQ